VAVEDVSFTVGRAEIVALLGPNGAGKTTTLRLIGGLIGPTSGSITIGGVELTRHTAGRLRARIGFLGETPGLWDRLTVRENLQVYAELYALPRPDRAVTQALEAFGLADRAASRAAELSKGMRQKAALARTLLHNPAILLLDEPTAGLDPEITRNVRQLLEERRAAGCSILVSTHNLDEADRLADRVAVLDRRLLALDRPAALRRRLTTGRVMIRVAGEAAAFLPTVRAFDSDAAADGATVTITLRDASDETPALVRALIQAGANLLEVQPEMPALEDVYLHLMGTEPGSERKRA
jgi:ABC-2 type transport system ATP-binding protein